MMLAAMDIEVATASILLIALLLGVSALIRTIRFAWFHRRLGPGVWRFIIASDAARAVDERKQ